MMKLKEIRTAVHKIFHIFVLARLIQVPFDSYGKCEINILNNIFMHLLWSRSGIFHITPSSVISFKHDKGMLRRGENLFFEVFLLRIQETTFQETTLGQLFNFLN